MFEHVLIFTQTCLFIKVYYWTYFCRFFVNLWDFIKDKSQVFNPHNCCFWPSAGRLHGRPSQRSVDRRAQNVHGLFGWRAGRPTRSTGRSTVRELCYLHPGHGWPTGRPVAQQSEIRPLAVHRPVDWPSQRSKNRLLAVDRAVDRQQCRLLIWTPTAIFWSLYIYMGLWAVLDKILREFLG